ncbi:MAG: diguanylate cyclase [Anaerolineales bacterium]
MTLLAAEFYRLDPLTGSQNFLSFVETLNAMSAPEKRTPFSILYADLNFFYTINEKMGHAHGDSVLRWFGIVLQEESNSPTFRIGGDDFAIILTDGTHSDHERLLQQIYTRLNREGEQLGTASPAAKIALIHFDEQKKFCIHDVMFHLWETIHDVQVNKERTIHIFWAQDLLQSDAKAEEQSTDSIKDSWELLQQIANNAISGVIGMGKALDTAQKNSYLDSISGLPNMRAALQKMAKEINHAAQTKQACSFLMLDGDNIKRYNNVSYADGDKMIQDMGVVLSESLRPGDFVARWRTGDEFMVILPNTSALGAKVVGERFCAAVREASKQWLFPTSISIGVAVYPKHGEHVHALVDAAEAANKRAKDEGKDRVILAE